MGAALAATTAGPDRPVFTRAEVIYYAPSELSATARYGWRAQTDVAKGRTDNSLQPIISVPPEADNRTQTIVTPSDIKLNHDVPLPNIVRVVAKQSPARDAAGINRNAELENTTLPVAAVAPAPETMPANRQTGTNLFSGGSRADCRRECGVFTHSAGPTGRDRPASAQRGRRFAAQFGKTSPSGTRK